MATNQTTEHHQTQGRLTLGTRTTGQHQRQEAGEEEIAVIRIGRRRDLAENLAASRADSPSPIFWLARSTIRIALPPARPISITRPTWA